MEVCIDMGKAICSFILIGLIQIYQKYFSVLYRGNCRFIPSCSQFAIQAIKKHGIYKGTNLAKQRLLRCRLPYGGFDPVE